MAAMLALLASAPPALGGELFVCREIVTGTVLREQGEAVEACIRDVVVKATGHPELRDDERLGPIVAVGAGLIEDVAYLDRMTDIPHHDEQGSRDRPFDLIAHLDEARLEGLMTAAGLAVWRERPGLLVSATVRRNGDQFRLDGDGDHSERHRRAVLEAGERYGLRIVLPMADQPQGWAPAARQWAVLTGEVVWSDADFGWNGFWALGEARWEVRGVSFDEAYRRGVGGAASRLAPGLDR